MPSLKEVADNVQHERRLPTGYAETMDKLKDADNWDVPGLIADAAEQLRTATDEGPAMAVIDTLVFRLKEIRSIARGDKHAFHGDRCKTIELLCDELVSAR